MAENFPNLMKDMNSSTICKYDELRDSHQDTSRHKLSKDKDKEKILQVAREK